MTRRPLVALALAVALSLTAWAVAGRTADAGPETPLAFSALTTAPAAGEDVQRTFSSVAAEAGFDPAAIRSAGRFAETEWYLVSNAEHGICLLSVIGKTWGAGCRRDALRTYDAAFWSSVSLGDSRQLAAVVVPDGYTDVTVTAGRDVEVTRPHTNLAFVAGTADSAIRLSGPDVSAISVDVPNRVRLEAKRARAGG